MAGAANVYIPKKGRRGETSIEKAHACAHGKPDSYESKSDGEFSERRAGGAGGTPMRRRVARASWRITLTCTFFWNLVIRYHF